MRGVAARPVEIVVFVAGATLLGVEIAASRVLAPFFGNSLFVWGALIGVVLAGLAVGYWFGGTLVDRFPSMRLLLGVAGAGALAVFAIPLLDGPVLRAIVSWDPGPRADPVLASVALFGPTSVLLAAVVPIAVRLRSVSVEDAGRTAGRLFALSTIGSIFGTFLTAFWLIPELGTDQLLGLVAATLFATITLLALSQRLVVASALSVAATVGAVVVALAVAPPSSGEELDSVALQNWSPSYRIRGRPAPSPVPTTGTVVYRKDTEYHRLYVIDEGGTRHLRFDSSYQSAMELAHPFKAAFEYTNYFDLGLAYHPRTRNVLFIGLGAGSAPKRMWRDFPTLDIDVVEIDPEVARVARRYFSFPRHPRLQVHVEDGRRFLTRNDRRWDVIAIDAFYADAIPFHLDHARVSRARPRPLSTWRRGRHECPRSRARQGLETPARALQNVSHRFSHGGASPGPRAAGVAADRVPEPDHRRHGATCAGSQPAAAALGGAEEENAARTGPHVRDP